MSIFITSFVILNLFLYFFNQKLAEIFNLYDFPDGKRKIHIKKVPLTGGIIFFSNVIFYLIFSYLNENINLFDGLENLNIFLLSCSIFFIMGLIDDKKNITPNIKLFVTVALIIVNLIFDKNSLISNVNLSFFQIFNLGNFSLVWTLICFLLFINAFNMFDGINLQTTIYSILISIIFIYNNYLISFFSILLISLAIFGFLNFNNKSFMGDSGTYLISYIFAYFFIRSYNEQSLFFADQIVLIMLIPGLDLIRLFFIRIFNKRHPFSADREHLHHYILKKKGYSKTLLIIQSLIFLPVVLSFIFGNTIFFLIAQLMIYAYLIKIFKN